MLIYEFAEATRTMIIQGTGSSQVFHLHGFTLMSTYPYFTAHKFSFGSVLSVMWVRVRCSVLLQFYFIPIPTRPIKWLFSLLQKITITNGAPYRCLYYYYAPPQRVGHNVLIADVCPSVRLSVPHLTLSREWKGKRRWNRQEGNPQHGWPIWPHLSIKGHRSRYRVPCCWTEAVMQRSMYRNKRVRETIKSWWSDSAKTRSYLRRRDYVLRLCVCLSVCQQITQKTVDEFW